MKYRVKVDDFLNHKRGDIVRFSPIISGELVKRGILERIAVESHIETGFDVDKMKSKATIEAKAPKKGK